MLRGWTPKSQALKSCAGGRIESRVSASSPRSTHTHPGPRALDAGLPVVRGQPIQSVVGMDSISHRPPVCDLPPGVYRRAPRRSPAVGSVFVCASVALPISISVDRATTAHVGEWLLRKRGDGKGASVQRSKSQRRFRGVLNRHCCGDETPREDTPLQYFVMSNGERIAASGQMMVQAAISHPRSVSDTRGSSVMTPRNVQAPASGSSTATTLARSQPLGSTLRAWKGEIGAGECMGRIAEQPLWSGSGTAHSARETPYVLGKYLETSSNCRTPHRRIAASVKGYPRLQF